jgi:hypothetical protein
MLTRPLMTAIAIVVMTSCGADYSKHAHEPVGTTAKPADGAPSLYVGSDSKSKMKVGAPYTAIVSMNSESPFTVQSVVYEQGGVKATVLDPSSSAVRSKPRSQTTEKMKVRLARVPLADLKWVAGSSITLRAEVVPEGATKPIIVEHMVAQHRCGGGAATTAGCPWERYG